MGVPLVDLRPQHAELASELSEAFERVSTTGHLVLGDEVEDFEHHLADFCGSRYAVGMSSGTDALLAALMAVGVGPGDEVVTTPFTFFCTAGCVARLGARPVFVDIDPNTFNLDASQLDGAITDKTKAIVPVHLYGQAADMETVMQLARERNVPVIEDAAQALGAKHRDVPVGTMGAIGCLSFYPTKNLAALGDGGACITNDERLAQKLRALRIHGSTDGKTYPLLGGNFRLDALQAALLNVKLPHVTAWNLARRALARRYDSLLEQYPVASPFVSPDGYHVFGVYSVRVFGGQRDALAQHLTAKEVGCRVYYPVPLHLQPCFRDLGYHRDSFPAAEAAADEVLALPMYPDLTRPQQDEVVAAVHEFFEGA